MKGRGGEVVSQSSIHVIAGRERTLMNQCIAKRWKAIIFNSTDEIPVPVEDPSLMERVLHKYNSRSMHIVIIKATCSGATCMIQIMV